MIDPQPKKSDLPTRAASAVVMVAVAGAALWLGGWVWTAFAVAVALGVLWEWWGLVAKLTASSVGRAIWMIGGLLYVGLACAALIALRADALGGALLVLGLVIAVDIGAYFAGRAIGGRKIAPSISPSKTWAGLGGGLLAAAVAWFIFWVLGASDDIPLSGAIGMAAMIGLVVAVVAQAGDFFESWMKRRAGVKDSGNLIPGHGGLFDRVDGLIAVLFLGGVIMAIGSVFPS